MVSEETKKLLARIKERNINAWRGIREQRHMYKFVMKNYKDSPRDIDYQRGSAEGFCDALNWLEIATFDEALTIYKHITFKEG